MVSPVPPTLRRALNLPSDPTLSSLNPFSSSKFTSTGQIRVFSPSLDDSIDDSSSTGLFGKAFLTTTTTSRTQTEAETKPKHTTTTNTPERESRNPASKSVPTLCGNYFVKFSRGTAAKEMFRGEFMSLNLIADAVPGLCPRALAWGCLGDDGDDDDRHAYYYRHLEEESWNISIASSGEDTRSYFLATEFLELDNTATSSRRRSTGMSRPQVLASRLAKLHSSPTPVVLVSSPSDVNNKKSGGDEAQSEHNDNNNKDGRERKQKQKQERRPQFGFPVPTYCGDTRQTNQFHDSWADFFAHERLLAILEQCELGCDKPRKPSGRTSTDVVALRQLVERTAQTVVPALLGDGHLKPPVTPVIVHGDLWNGNAGYGRVLPTFQPPILRPLHEEEDVEKEEVGDDDFQSKAVIYDPSACYAHNEYELGIMRMFGGFSNAFFDEYHQLIPKTEPVEEYDDRILLYQLYHYLNHFAIFKGASYYAEAVAIMEQLLRKYDRTTSSSLA